MEAILTAVRDEGSFKELVFKGRAGALISWKELRVRPILLKRRKLIQVLTPHEL
jgi:hypothetical protein